MEQNILCATLNEAVPIVRSQQNFGMKNWFEIKQKKANMFFVQH